MHTHHSSASAFPSWSSLRAWVAGHDEFPAFRATYLLGVFLAAALFNIGVFLLLVIAHMTCDFVKYRDVHGWSWGATLKGVIRESLVDLLLLSIALCSAVYVHNIAAIVAVSGMLESEIIIVRALAILVPHMEVLAHVSHVFVHLRAHMLHVRRGMKKAWTLPEKLAMAGIGTMLALVLMAPDILGLSMSAYAHLLREMLVPGI